MLPRVLYQHYSKSPKSDERRKSRRIARQRPVIPSEAKNLIVRTTWVAARYCERRTQAILIDRGLAYLTDRDDGHELLCYPACDAVQAVSRSASIVLTIDSAGTSHSAARSHP